MKVYIAGPYSAPTCQGRIDNTMRAVDAYIDLIGRGHEPFCPHFSHFADERAKARGIDIPYGEWMRQDIEWLRECDAILYLGASPGANIERDIARDLCKPIYDRVEDIP
jgi:hypothetical protein